MSTQLRAGPATNGSRPAADIAAPAARRLGSGRWRDPRLAVGVVLVAGSVLLGARVLASADDTTAVWSVRSDVPAGSALTSESVDVDDVRLADADDAALYLLADQPFPVDLVAAHDLVAGELVGRSDVRLPTDRPGAEVPVAVLDGHRPTDLAAGDRVDVWVTPEQAAQSAPAARQVLAGVEVVAVDATSGGIGAGSGAVVLLGLEEPGAESMPAVLSAITAGTVVLVRVGG